MTRFRIPEPREVNYIYRCKQCAKEVAFVIRLPAHLERHNVDKRLGCTGELEFVREERL